MDTVIYSIISFFVTLGLFIPFINLLYKIEMQDKNPEVHKDAFGKKTPIFNKLRKDKISVPVGGGLLVVSVVTGIFLILSFAFDFNPKVSTAIIGTFIPFMLLGLLDDIKKTLNIKGKIEELRMWHKLIIQLIIASLISAYAVNENLITLEIPHIISITNPILLTSLSTVAVTGLLNCFNITDGVDGLSAGLFFISLVPLWIISTIQGDFTVQVFISVLSGGVIAYLYFNVNPARILMGDTGSLAFGSILALLMMLLDVSYLIPILGFIFIAEGASSALQIAHRKIFDRKLFKVAPMHYNFEVKGWKTWTLTFRFWLAGIVLSLIAMSIYNFL
jgi:phospho-N-acetylmuramoyl-pentapeptide-transferase